MDHTAFRAAFEEHAAFVWRVLARYGLARPERQDACQEVFLVLYRKGGPLDGRSSLRTWLYGTAVRVALATRRRDRRRRERLAELALPPDAPPQPFESLHGRELQAQLMAALAVLSPRRREVFVLYELEEMTIAEAARALGIPENTALYRLYAAREAIAAYVQRQPRLLKRGKTEVA
jgi:RNA polymerase sigma-70 factor (ECF subfamily)